MNLEIKWVISKNPDSSIVVGYVGERRVAEIWYAGYEWRWSVFSASSSNANTLTSAKQQIRSHILKCYKIVKEQQ